MAEKLITLAALISDHLVPSRGAAAIDGAQQTAYLAQHNIFEQIPALRPLVRHSSLTRHLRVIFKFEAPRCHGSGVVLTVLLMCNRSWFQSTAVQLEGRAPE